MVKIAILGHGVVGAGVAQLLFSKVEFFRRKFENKDFIQRKIGEEIILKKILDIKEFKNLPYSNLFVKDFDEILNDDEISIVVETMGGLNPAYEFVKKLLEKKKNVVTSNKELVCEKGFELLKIAKDNDVSFLFEASVGGGMPIVSPLLFCFVSSGIGKIEGILNGTTNFILTKMTQENLSLEEAVKLAQELGYAERDPSDDINGVDSARKICILAELADLKYIPFKKVTVKGIKDIDLVDILYGKSVELVLKLIATVKISSTFIENIEVFPCFLEKTHKLYQIDGVLNGVVINNEVMFTGEGAGRFPTARAIWSDIALIVKSSLKNISPVLEVDDHYTSLSYKEKREKFYIRLETKDLDKAKKIITDYFTLNFKILDKDVECVREIKYLEREGKREDELAFIVCGLLKKEILDLEKILDENGIEMKAKFKILSKDY